MSGKFYVGVDLGQSRDSTAIAIVQIVGEQYRLGHLERVPLGTPYPSIIGRVSDLMRRLPGAMLAIDATGVGRPVCDMFSHAGVHFTGVIITGGTEESSPGNGYRHVPKVTLISHVQSLLHAGELKIRADLPEAAVLVRELQDFRVNFSATGHMSFSAREGRHDDLVLALAIAVWLGRRQPKPMTFPPAFVASQPSYYRAFETARRAPPAGSFDVGGGSMVTPPGGWPAGKNPDY
jgi:hypothetical protein